MANESATKEVVKALADHFTANVAGVQKVYEEWPNANQRLVYPAISITTQSPSFEALPRYEASSTPIGVDNKKTVKYVIGQYNFNLQVDLWARNKEERNDLYERFFQAFNSQNPSAGLSLVLTDYHAIFCRYDMTDYRYEDSEVAAQTQEWRAIISVIANCKAIIERDEFAMVILPTPAEIEEEGEISETFVQPEEGE